MSRPELCAGCQDPHAEWCEGAADCGGLPWDCHSRQEAYDDGLQDVLAGLVKLGDDATAADVARLLSGMLGPDPDKAGDQ